MSQAARIRDRAIARMMQAERQLRQIDARYPRGECADPDRDAVTGRPIMPVVTAQQEVWYHDYTPEDGWSVRRGHQKVVAADKLVPGTHLLPITPLYGAFKDRPIPPGLVAAAADAFMPLMRDNYPLDRVKEYCTQHLLGQYREHVYATHVDHNSCGHCHSIDGGYQLVRIGTTVTWRCAKCSRERALVHWTWDDRAADKQERLHNSYNGPLPVVVPNAHPFAGYARFIRTSAPVSHQHVDAARCRDRNPTRSTECGLVPGHTGHHQDEHGQLWADPPRCWKPMCESYQLTVSSYGLVSCHLHHVPTASEQLDILRQMGKVPK